MEPASGSYRRSKSLNSVDLPTPFLPQTATKLPALICNNVNKNENENEVENENKTDFLCDISSSESEVNERKENEGGGGGAVTNGINHTTNQPNYTTQEQP